MNKLHNSYQYLKHKEKTTKERERKKKNEKKAYHKIL